MFPYRGGSIDSFNDVLSLKPCLFPFLLEFNVHPPKQYKKTAMIVSRIAFPLLTLRQGGEKATFNTTKGWAASSCVRSSCSCANVLRQSLICDIFIYSFA